MSDPRPPDERPEAPAGAGGLSRPPRSVVDEGFLETAVGVITEPVTTLRALTERPNVAWAIWLTLGISLLTSVAGAAQLGADPAAEEFLPDVAAFRTAMLAGAVIGGPLLGLLYITVVAAVLQGVSTLLGGEGSFRGMFAGVAFANIPSVFGVVAQLLPLALGFGGALLATVISIGLSVWVVVLGAIAVRENHSFTTGRAVAVVLIPFVVLFVLGILLAIVIAALFFAALGG